ncbi:hypothetical protein ABKV19_019655 [Rosa sericea]
MGQIQLVAALLVCLGVLLAAFVVLVLWRLDCCKKRKETGNQTTPRRVNIRSDQSLEAGIAKLHNNQQQGLQVDHVSSKKTGNNYYMYRRGVSGKASPLFSWSDHPSSVTDAVENGWSRFAFATTYTSSPSTRSRRLLGLCAVGEHRVRETEPEISWEVCQGSVDFMQKIRLNSGLKRVLNAGNTTAAAASVIRTALPLPGPPLGNNSFPQEAYFEITVLFSLGDEVNSESEKTKLIKEKFIEMPSSESLVHVTSSAQRNNKIEELKLGVIDEHDQRKEEAVLLSLGLTTGGLLPMKLPGSYPGSIGFGSNGSVHLDGIKLAFESEKAAWGRTDHVIGCGFDPRQKKVYFTVESELVHVVHCKSEEFGTPLYPTLAANTDIEVLVNFGQSVFKYAPANAHRTPNPCFVGPLGNASSHAFYEDSKELFSMGRIDSQWLNRSTTRGSQYPGTANRALDFDEESNDLFEIVLDSCGRSPNTVL